MGKFVIKYTIRTLKLLSRLVLTQKLGYFVCVYSLH